MQCSIVYILLINSVYLHTASTLACPPNLAPSSDRRHLYGPKKSTSVTLFDCEKSCVVNKPSLTSSFTSCDEETCGTKFGKIFLEANRSTDLSTLHIDTPLHIRFIGNGICFSWSYSCTGRLNYGCEDTCYSECHSTMAEEVTLHYDTKWNGEAKPLGVTGKTERFVKFKLEQLPSGISGSKRSWSTHSLLMSVTPLITVAICSRV
ncbi:uncharacterized protein LOC106157637 [Lingula anatina]|uniref:Uncharacterized protein LOC106157637 n=1 Tax=Lingula anatina TaxID=7574 RepID=A0A1S3HUS3_LINAN|nr:uncharacterized protein LOC106157637 [Lingula anatina]|eukprot:XP_013388804.1 uncharacterized protein LOC106157637 [Lingula anatina]